MSASRYHSKGPGTFVPGTLGSEGAGCVLEPGVLVFHPEMVHLGAGVYVGHQAIIHGYPNGELRIGNGSWVGPQSYLHSAGGIVIGRNVGIGPAVRMLTSSHREAGRDTPILHAPLEFAAIRIDDDVDIGIGSVILPGVHIGTGALIGAGSVVTRDIPAYAVAFGSPARVQRERPLHEP